MAPSGFLHSAGALPRLLPLSWQRPGLLGRPRVVQAACSALQETWEGCRQLGFFGTGSVLGSW